ncbi:MAG: hypothetical protein GXP63_00555 [DPANN group archaeon]|nr:hypothetical protein [DPANN group archaeon]
MNRFFGFLLVLLGILIFTLQLNRIANFSLLTDFLLRFSEATIGAGSSLSLGIAFLAGMFSFLSPCVLPLVPAFLSYLATVSTRRS